MLTPLAADPAGLQEHQSQPETTVSATVAIAAAHWILQQQQPLDVFHAEA
jgi:hypothetical protein